MNESRRRGRPPVAPEDRAVPICVSVPSREYSSLLQEAQRRGTSVPEVIRTKMRHRGSSDDDDDE